LSGPADICPAEKEARDAREMAVAGPDLLENRRAPATTLEGWRSFITADPSELALLPLWVLIILSPDATCEYSRTRLAGWSR
jgi:hypothetical protein